MHSHPLDNTTGSGSLLHLWFLPHHPSNAHTHQMSSYTWLQKRLPDIFQCQEKKKKGSFKIIFHTGNSLLFAHLYPTTNLRFNTSGYLPKGKLVESLWFQSIYFDSDLNNLFWSCIAFALSRTLPEKKYRFLLVECCGGSIFGFAWLGNYSTSTYFTICKFLTWVSSFSLQY